MSVIKRVIDVFPGSADLSPSEYVPLVVAKGAYLRDGKMPTKTVKKGGPSAYVNHGRWIVECPAGCGDAQIGDPEDPYFFCTTCGNDDRWQWLEVVYPDDEFIAQLEEQMGRIKDVRNRNWLPGETIEDITEMIDVNQGMG